MEKHEDNQYIASVSVVIPVYQGEKTISNLVNELALYVAPSTSPAGIKYVISEVLLVHDSGPDDSAKIINDLSTNHEWVRPVWLSRNFGQHAATLAGMSTSVSDWIVTLDEDGQHDPKEIATLLDTAVAENSQLVYGKFAGGALHSWWRNFFSSLAKWFYTKLLSPQDGEFFSSFRLMTGEIGRSVGAYAGSGVYLDVALTWVVDRSVACEIAPRVEYPRQTGFTFRRLLGHFLRLVLSSGTRPLRLVSLIGFSSFFVGVVYAAYAIYGKIAHGYPVEGWTTVIIFVSMGSGAILFSLGILAEYLGVVVRNAIGRPLYLIRSSPFNDALSRTRKSKPSN
ncbi:undecaprenyl-phosphate 4-deoxy-4-formamido-L-arabinose transferase [Acidimicrobiaceae bacterium]|nr:undecaprenyl-phosphate 4-deoxy-4-formamido-L-arabinose transferase [Acidimicrobiaceae bacterium]